MNWLILNSQVKGKKKGAAVCRQAKNFLKKQKFAFKLCAKCKGGGVSFEGDKGSLSNFARNEKAVRKTFTLWKALLREEKGSILFLVILFAAALLLLGAAFLRSSLQEKLIARNYTQKIKAHYIAEAGMEAALTLLQNQPDYFLCHDDGVPVYMYRDCGTGEEYFRLEWLEADQPADDGEYYTLKAHGYARSAFENRDARAEIKALVRISQVEENGEEDNNGAGDENGTGKTSITLLHLSGH